MFIKIIKGYFKLNNEIEEPLTFVLLINKQKMKKVYGRIHKYLNTGVHASDSQNK